LDSWRCPWSCSGNDAGGLSLDTEAPMNDGRLKELSERIEELNRKSTQVLMFLTFGITAAVLIWSNSTLGARQKELVIGVMRAWVWAIFPVLVGILPVKDLRDNNIRWYNFLRWFKFMLLWLAVGLVCWGALDFARAVYLR